MISHRLLARVSNPGGNSIGAKPGSSLRLGKLFICRRTGICTAFHVRWVLRVDNAGYSGFISTRRGKKRITPAAISSDTRSTRSSTRFSGVVPIHGIESDALLGNAPRADGKQWSRLPTLEILRLRNSTVPCPRGPSRCRSPPFGKVIIFLVFQPVGANRAERKKRGHTPMYLSRPAARSTYITSTLHACRSSVEICQPIEVPCLHSSKVPAACHPTINSSSVVHA